MVVQVSPGWLGRGLIGVVAVEEEGGRMGG